MDGLALCLCDFGEGSVGVEGRVCGAQARVAGAVDALGRVVGDELGRRVARVQLDLVGGGDDLGVGAAEELLEVGDAKVGDANVADLAGADELLHLAPGVDKVPVVVVLLLAGHRRAGPVHQVQVDVVGAQLAQAVGQGLGHALVVRVVELGRQPDLLSRDARLLDALAHFLFVAVRRRRVNVSVACLERCLDGGSNLSGLGLPCSQADGGDLVSRVEGKGATAQLVSQDTGGLDTVCKQRCVLTRWS